MLRNLFSRPEKKPGPVPVKTIYRSNDVPIPEDFLVTLPPDAKPITHTPLNFESSVLPEFAGCYAVILDNVLSASECKQLLQLAEASVMDEDKAEDGSPWRDALVHMGGGYEIEVPDYRKSGRIIWDQQEIVDRMWARMVALPEIKEKLSFVTGYSGAKHPFYRVNKRLRFLKYTPGQFFRAHCDGAYGEKTEDGRNVMTFMTVHIYLNDSVQEVGKGAGVVGGATSFLSRDETRKMDVDPRAGRVLIFQHDRLRHCGADVEAGTKYSVRTDIMYDLGNERV